MQICIFSFPNGAIVAMWCTADGELSHVFHVFPAIFWNQAWVYLARAKMALGGRREAYRALQEAVPATVWGEVRRVLGVYSGESIPLD